MIRSTINRFATLGVICAAVLTGCHDPVKAPPAGQADTIELADYPQIAVIDGLQEYFGFHRPVVEPSTSQRAMNVMVPMRSLADSRLAVQYQFRFFDEIGRELPAGGWTYLKIEPRLLVQLRGTAMSTTAKAWQLEVRSSR